MKKKARLVQMLVMVTFVFGCGVQKQKNGNEFKKNVNLPQKKEFIHTSDYIPFSWDNKHKDYRKWNQHAYDGIVAGGRGLINNRPRDIISFCPNYDNLNRDGKAMFWIGLFSAMTRYESNYNPDAWFREDFQDGSGKRVVSRGLLQLSLESARAYGCGLINGEDLFNARKNLFCSIRVMNKWVSKDRYISRKIGRWRGGARYWGVLRNPKLIKAIRQKTRILSVCK